MHEGKKSFFSMHPHHSIWYNSSFRRYTVVVLGTLMVVGKGLGVLILSTEEISMYLVFLTTVVLGSNYKEIKALPTSVPAPVNS